MSKRLTSAISECKFATANTRGNDELVVVELLTEDAALPMEVVQGNRIEMQQNPMPSRSPSKRRSRRRGKKASSGRPCERAYISRNKPQRNSLFYSSTYDHPRSARTATVMNQKALPPLDYIYEGDNMCRADESSIDVSTTEGGSVTEGDISLDEETSLSDIAQLERDLFPQANILDAPKAGDKNLRLFIPQPLKQKDILGTLPSVLQNTVLEFFAPSEANIPTDKSGALLVKLLDSQCPCNGLNFPCTRCARVARSAWAYSESSASRDAAVIRQAQYASISIRTVCRTWADLWDRPSSDESRNRNAHFTKPIFQISHEKVHRETCHGLSLADRTWSKVSMRALKPWVVSKELLCRIVESHGDRITCVDLSGVKQLSDESVRSVLESCHRLCSLSVRKTRVRASAFRGANRPSTLTSLNLSHCTAVRDSIVDILARSYATLLSLEMAGCKRLTDGSLRALSSTWCGPRLTSLDMGNATSITAEATDVLLESQRDLRVLNLGGCRIEDDAMVELAAKHRHCRIYRR